MVRVTTSTWTGCSSSERRASESSNVAKSRMRSPMGTVSVAGQLFASLGDRCRFGQWRREEAMQRRHPHRFPRMIAQPDWDRRPASQFQPRQHACF